MSLINIQISSDDKNNLDPVVARLDRIITLLEEIAYGDEELDGAIEEAIDLLGE